MVFKPDITKINRKVEDDKAAALKAQQEAEAAKQAQLESRANAALEAHWAAIDSGFENKDLERMTDSIKWATIFLDHDGDIVSVINEAASKAGIDSDSLQLAKALFTGQTTAEQVQAQADNQPTSAPPTPADKQPKPTPAPQPKPKPKPEPKPEPEPEPEPTEATKPAPVVEATDPEAYIELTETLAEARKVHDELVKQADVLNSYINENPEKMFGILGRHPEFDISIDDARKNIKKIHKAISALSKSILKLETQVKEMQNR